MARIPLIDEHDPALASETRDILLKAGVRRGRLLNVHRALANRPEALVALSALLQTVYRDSSSLDPLESELAYLTASAINDCFY